MEGLHLLRDFDLLAEKELSYFPDRQKLKLRKYVEREKGLTKPTVF